MPAAAPITLDNVTIDFAGGVRAVEGVSLAIPPGEFLVLVGPSGCGKSTLLRAIAGLTQPTSGNITGVDAGKLGLVFQDANLLPWRRVDRNVALPLELRGTPKAQRLAAAAAALRDVGLADAARRYPHQLSGGMRMRASVARALTTQPEVLLMDEPFGALDEITRFRLDELTRAQWQSRRNTVIFVTHSLSEALFLGTRILVLSKRPGRVILDHAVTLPEPRTSGTRLDEPFAAQMHVLHDALTRAEGGAS
jgi:NitT/TauT family transport system ATP-binding protein